MSREISYQVRHVVTLPDDYPEGDEPTNVTIEFDTNAAVLGAVVGDRDLADTNGIGVTTTSERLDK